MQWNDADALEQALAPGDVACVLAEPALTNIGIVLPEPGFHDALRELTRRTGTLLIIDETHTFSAGPGGCTAAWGLEPDLLTIGKAIGGGVPAGAYGVTDDVAERIAARADADYEDVGGIGGTLAGNALSLAAVRATLDGGIDRGGVRPDDPARGALRRRRRRCDRERRPALARDRAGRTRGVPLLGDPAPERRPSRPPPATRSSSASCTCTRSTAAC